VDIKHIQITITGVGGEKLTGLYDGHGNPLSNHCYQVHSLLAKLPAGPRMPPISEGDAKQRAAALSRINELEGFLSAANERIESLSRIVSTTTEASTAAASAEFAVEALEGFTVSQLRDHAERNGIDLSGLSRKDDIIDAIIAAESAAHAEGDDSDGS
jgi:hypothetical protein